MRRNQLAHQGDEAARSTAAASRRRRVESVTPAATPRRQCRSASTISVRERSRRARSTLASRLSSSDSGSMFELPTVAHCRSLSCQPRRAGTPACIPKIRIAVAAQLVVQHLRRQRGEAVDRSCLAASKAHAQTPALGGGIKARRKQPSRIEVRGHQVDAFARAQHRLDVAARSIERAAAPVVAHEEGHADRCRCAQSWPLRRGATRRRRCKTPACARQRLRRCEPAPSPPRANRRPARARLHTARTACVDAGGHRTAQLDRKVQARRYRDRP